VRHLLRTSLLLGVLGTVAVSNTNASTQYFVNLSTKTTNHSEAPTEIELNDSASSIANNQSNEISENATFAPSPSITPFEFNACELKDPVSARSARAECAYFPLAENPDNPDGKPVNIHVARLESLSRNKHPDPLLFITGGPGQAASESWATIQSAFHALRKNRDVYVIDQRGTGQSNKLDCPEIETSTDVFTFDETATAERAKACLEGLQSNPRYYTTSVAVQDLESIRQKLGVEQWNIYGVSYGTRVALHYLRRFPDHVRTMTLDAVVPPGTALGPGIAIDAENALQAMFDRCREDDACSDAYPQLEQGARTLLSDLRESPVDINYENFNRGTLESTQITENHVTLTMRMLSYSSHGVAILPNMLHEAYAKKNFAPFARQAELQSENLGQTLATGMHNAIICTEDTGHSGLQSIDKDALKDTYLGDTALKALDANCKHWPSGIIDDDFHTPVKSDAQVLVLSGGTDPVTPPAYGERAISQMPNALHIINPFQGHVQVALGCMPRVVANFIERGQTGDVDFGCLERLRAEPFFVDANGPRP